MTSRVNVSACYPVKQMVRMHEGCRLRMTCRPEIWTRQIDDTRVALMTPDVCGDVRERSRDQETGRKRLGLVTAVAVVWQVAERQIDASAGSTS